MKSTLLTTLKVAAVLGVLIPAVSLAQGPGIPHQFYGTVSYDSGTTPAGLTVRALVGSTVVSTSATQSNGQYGVNPDLLIVSGQTAGATILFTVNDIPARETAAFTNGTLSQLNLTVPGSATTPTPTPSSSGGGGGSTGGGGDGDGGGTPPPTTPTSPLSAAAQKVDVNNGGDGKVDVLDFTVLMINWGSTDTSNTADFNEDGVVDILDFTLLMIHWTG